MNQLYVTLQDTQWIERKSMRKTLGHEVKQITNEWELCSVMVHQV